MPIRRRLLALAVVAAVCAMATAPTARAHTGVQRATPGPGSVVTGVVDEVELVFLDPVRDGATIEVSDPDGATVLGLGGVVQERDGLTASVAFAPLETAGSYVVDYSYVALDGDQQTDAYRFTYSPRTSSDSSARGAILAGVALLLGAIGVGVALVRRRRTL